MTSSSQQLHEVWVFFLQGFHLRTHPIQTLVTFLLLLGFAGSIGSAIHTLATRFLNWYRFMVSFVTTSALITKEQWFEHKRLVGDIEGKVGSVAAAKLEAAHAVAEVNLLNTRIGGVDARVQRLEQSPVPQVNAQGALIPAEFKEFRLEVDNLVDEMRESARLFREEFEQRLMLVEMGYEAPAVYSTEVVPEDDPTIVVERRRKTKKTKRKKR